MIEWKQMIMKSLVVLVGKNTNNGCVFQCKILSKQSESAYSSRNSEFRVNPETILIYKITKNVVAKLIACKKNAPRPNARPDLLVTIAYGLFN